MAITRCDSASATSNRQQQLAHLWLNMASIKLHLLFSLQMSANRAASTCDLTGPTCFHRNGGGFRTGFHDHGQWLQERPSLRHP